jgi:hypothetical protein
MAEIAASVTKLAGDGSVIKCVWTGLTTNDTGVPFKMVEFADRCVQITGTFGGATVNIKGSNDGTNYDFLTDPQGNNIAKTVQSAEAITECMEYLRPDVSGGAGTSVTITLVARRNNPMRT